MSLVTTFHHFSNYFVQILGQFLEYVEEFLQLRIASMCVGTVVLFLMPFSRKLIRNYITQYAEKKMTLK